MAPSDAELLDRWRTGDNHAGEQLFDRYYTAVERFFLNKVSAGFGDLAQETFRKCLHARERLLDGQKFRSYLFTIAYNTLRTHYRNAKPDTEPIDFQTASVATLAPGPSSLLAQKREQRLLLEGLRRIPVEQQVLLELHYWEDLTTAEIAQVLARPRNTIKGQLQRARDALAAQMAKIAESADLLRSTLSDLDGWAARCRRQMAADSPDDSS